MNTPMLDILRQIKAEITAYETKSKVTKGSDRKKYKALAQRLRDLSSQISVGVLLEYCSPALSLLSPENCKAIKAGAEEKGVGTGAYLRDMLRNLCMEFATLEQTKNGGALFTVLAQEWLNRVNWGFIGEHIDSMFQEPISSEETMPTPKTCPKCHIQSQVAPVENKGSGGHHCKCFACGHEGPVAATIPQAIISWNEEELQSVAAAATKTNGVDRKPAIGERDEPAILAWAAEYGISIPAYVLASWEDDRVAALAGILTQLDIEGAAALMPTYISIYHNYYTTNVADEDLRELLKRVGISVPLDKLMRWEKSNKIEAAAWADLQFRADNGIAVTLTPLPAVLERWKS